MLEQTHLLDAAPILLLPVRITPRKNIELGLHVLAELRNQFPHAALLVTGPLGPHNANNLKYFEMLSTLRSQLSLQGSVYFLAELVDSFLPDEVIADFYRIADALFFPSREEGFGIPLIEAAFSHLPAFCADIPPLRELGLDDATFFSPDEDPAKVADHARGIFSIFIHRAPIHARTFIVPLGSDLSSTYRAFIGERIRPMQKHSEFIPIHTILVPFVYKGPGLQALEAARHLDAKIILVGIVIVPPDQSLSIGAAAARALRKQLRHYGKDELITSRSQIIVSHQPWHELSSLLQKEKPDLLCLEWDSHFTAFGVTTNDVLTRPPCDIALVRGKLPNKPKQVLVPVRGGPHAELSLRVGLGLRPKELTSSPSSQVRRPGSRKRCPL